MTVRGRPDYAPYLDGGDGPFRWRLGLRPLDPDDWIEIGDDYVDELAAKHTVRSRHPATVFVALDDAATTAACAEILAALADHLVTRFPERFARAGRHLHNVAMDERYDLDGDLHPLDVAGRLVQEDLVVMATPGGEPAGVPVFAAGSVCFPNRWDLASKLGRTMEGVHEAVADLNETLAVPIARFLDRLTPGRGFWRLGWGVIDTDELFQPLDGSAGPRPAQPQAADLVLRVERETLRRFPRTGAVLFTIRTYTTRLADMVGDTTRLARLQSQIDTMSPGIAGYKQIDHLRPALDELFADAG